MKGHSTIVYLECCSNTFIEGELHAKSCKLRQFKSAFEMTSEATF